MNEEKNNIPNSTYLTSESTHSATDLPISTDLIKNKPLELTLTTKNIEDEYLQKNAQTESTIKQYGLSRPKKKVLNAELKS